MSKMQERALLMFVVGLMACFLALLVIATGMGLYALVEMV